jgi:hypothetical protein
MLSYILGLAFRFEREHGFLPNSLRLNQRHLQHLCAELGLLAAKQLSERLGLAVIVHPGLDNPQVMHIFQPKKVAPYL